MSALMEAGKALVRTVASTGKEEDGGDVIEILPIPKDVKKRLDAGLKALKKGSALRRLCLRFFRGDSYWYIDRKGFLAYQPLVVYPGGKPQHRVRNRYNFIRPIIQGKTSAATQRIPGYQVMPSKTDPDAWFAAELSTMTARYGYDKWRLRRKTIKTVEYALVCDGGFAYPYFDTTVGPFITRQNPETGEVESVGQGEVRVKVLNGSEVMWEPGEDFDDSRWHAIYQALTVDETKRLPGFLGGPLRTDATTSDVPGSKEHEGRVMVTHYFERPCAEHPDGRLLVIADGRQIVKPDRFPCRDAQDRPVDEPPMHMLSWTTDPEDDREQQGLVESLIDLERVAQDCLNKISEWKNRALHPQMIAPRGSKLERRTDEPGMTWLYNPGTEKPEWEKPPQIPPELFSFFQLIVQQMRDLAADSQTQAEADLAAATVTAVIEQNERRWQTFLADLADWHSRLMRHCLYLVARYYTEDRLLAIQGDFGPDLIPSFRGADLLSQVDVRVMPESLQPLTQQAVEQRATNWATMGWISPTAAMRAIDAGTTDGLMRGYEQDVGRMNRILGLIRQGPEALFALPKRWDPYQPQIDPATGAPVLNPMTGAPVMGTFVPGWMPRRFDDPDVQIEVLVAWMKGNEFARLEPGMQEAGYAVYDALTMEQQRRAVEAQVQQTQMAEGLGMANAARPQLGKPTPSLPSTSRPTSPQAQPGGQGGE